MRDQKLQERGVKKVNVLARMDIYIYYIKDTLTILKSIAEHFQ